MDKYKAFNLYKPLLLKLPVQTLPVFTTNYDLAVEKACERGKVKLIDGFRREYKTAPEWSSGSVYESYEPAREGGDVVLFKLHGSVDWQLTPSGPIQRVEAEARDPEPMKTVLIYPSRQEAEIDEEPFAVSYAYLSACLTHTQVCLVIGFSFRDREVVDRLRVAMDVNEKLRLLILDPNADSITEHLIDKLGGSCSKIELRIETLQSECSSELSNELPQRLSSLLETNKH
jgi:hypothetical protein